MGLGSFLSRLFESETIVLNPTCNVENMRTFIEALESEEYEQIKHVLYRGDNRFCAEGVACEVSGVGYWRCRDRDYNLFEYVTPDHHRSQAIIIAPAVREWLGLGHEHPMFNATMTVSEANDAGYSFDQIAAGLLDFYGVTK